MEAFEGVRSTAARLHDELVAAGADPLKPTLLVDAAIDKLQLELYLLKPGDPALKGAHALFDEQSGTICLRDGRGTGGPCTPHRSRGWPRVRPRRLLELQRLRRRRLTLDRGRSRRPPEGRGLRRQGAAGTPGECVSPGNSSSLARSLAASTWTRGWGQRPSPSGWGSRRTWSDNNSSTALLLPPTTVARAEDPAAGPPLIPDPSQDRAATHRGSPFQLQAGPGTGKTRTLVKTVLALLEEGVHPTAILILTFSNPRRRRAGRTNCQGRTQRREPDLDRHLPRLRSRPFTPLS